MVAPQGPTPQIPFGRRTMPNTVSAKKRLQQNVKRRARNRAVKSTIRTQIKKIIGLVRGGDTAAAEQASRVAAKLLDRGCQEHHPSQRGSPPEVAAAAADQEVQAAAGRHRRHGLIG